MTKGSWPGVEYVCSMTRDLGARTKQKEVRWQRKGTRPAISLNFSAGVFQSAYLEARLDGLNYMISFSFSFLSFLPFFEYFFWTCMAKMLQEWNAYKLTKHKRTIVFPGGKSAFIG